MVNDNEPEFLFFFSSGLWTASSARGDGGGVMVEPEIVSEALKKTWRREAICLSVQVLNILVSFNCTVPGTVCSVLREFGNCI